MVRIESAFLNADQEQKLNNVINLAEKLAGFKFRDIQGRVQVPKGLGSIRVVMEGLQAAHALESWLEEAKATPYEDIEKALEVFYGDVVEHELEQIEDGVQRFVAERDEATQE